jgi:hypothetical protein
VKVKKHKAISATVKLDDEFEIKKLRTILAYYVTEKDQEGNAEDKDYAGFAYELWRSLIKLGDT